MLKKIKFAGILVGSQGYKVEILSGEFHRGYMVIGRKNSTGFDFSHIPNSSWVSITI
jgi:hypothetical protein